MYTSTLILSLVAAAAAACTGGKNKTAEAAAPGAKAQCALQFDGRIPKAFTAADFDGKTSPFNTANVFGKGLKFSDLIKLPGGQSLFDVNSTQPFEVTIDDKSIFAPSADNVQIGFRRAEMLPLSNDGKDASTQGIKTLHFSLQKDDKRPLNLSHEYQLAFLESADFSTNQIVLKTGTILGQNTEDPDTLQLFGNVATSPPPELFKTKFTPGVFHNFAIKLDFTAKYVSFPPQLYVPLILTFDCSTTEVFYSQGTSALKSQGAAVPNIIAGQGQYHFGILKKPVNGGADITKSGDQPADIDEGLIYAGIFQEDSANGCISLSP
ncbi:hypothetical protein CH63R_06596 [Colletotrichum higginsianum IMI 349063]|uniref:Glycoside hydrolase 131 catalytic N-terminal domain-containing protein n=1 Tax=Colletotrichum higginsianum (strain IMI 349063) TaxID=759273 RepID=A0A1B7YG91_COLHI|nr:hypothetical protein CH63R_06596 [Colletotrichum higginsianum IMI 349063]OBR10904.1 hypothetical protein CH63R_06596 [Colletotrichum higginsianum IMI 349063]